MAAVPRLSTDDDVQQMPEGGLRRELIAGDVLVNPAPRFEQWPTFMNASPLTARCGASFAFSSHP